VENVYCMDESILDGKTFRNGGEMVARTRAGSRYTTVWVERVLYGNNTVGGGSRHSPQMRDRHPGFSSDLNRDPGLVAVRSGMRFIGTYGSKPADL